MRIAGVFCLPIADYYVLDHINVEPKSMVVGIGVLCLNQLSLYELY